jgi:polar amino acid transport system substrate-binding protein
LVFVTACAGVLSSEYAHARSIEEIKKSGQLRIGVEPGFIPFEMTLSNGEWIGFDVDMMEAFAKQLGVKLSFVDTKWDGIIPALMAGKFDLIVSGMTITEERKKAVLFSDPYYDAGLLVMISAAAKDKFKKLADLDKPNIKVAVKQGTTGDIFAKKTIKNASILKLESEADAANSVLLGKVDAFIYDKPFLKLFAGMKDSKAALLEDLLSQEQFGAAARPQDKNLIASFNEFLKAWRSSGGYAAAMDKHFVQMPWKSKIEKLW